MHVTSTVRQTRQRAANARIRGTEVGVGRVAEARGATTENLRARRKLHANSRPMARSYFAIKLRTSGVEFRCTALFYQDKFRRNRKDAAPRSLRSMGTQIETIAYLCLSSIGAGSTAVRSDFK